MSQFDDLEEAPQPEGELLLKVVAAQGDTNLHRDIAASWVITQMEVAAELAATRLANGRTATVSVSGMDFLCPIRVGSLVQVHGALLETGKSSMRFKVEVWMLPLNERSSSNLYKVTEATFVMVALDDKGRIRSLPDNR